ncbi:MAG TPA: hypothetical protein VN714_24305 [Trebonia sp.]|nr:hypothetical protein [Trebonia sp.]
MNRAPPSRNTEKPTKYGSSAAIAAVNGEEQGETRNGVGHARACGLADVG